MKKKQNDIFVNFIKGVTPIKKSNKLVFPEVELITYNTKRGVRYITPHVDNDSILTAVFLLTSPKRFKGGNFHVSPIESKDINLGKLTLGGAVIFRGEHLTHWIDKVTEGIRIILQIEISKSYSELNYNMFYSI